MPVYVLGDSITKGVYLNAEGRYLINKEAMMEKVFNTLGLECLNHSVFGATVDKGDQLFQRRKNRYIKDSFVFLLFGGNDCNFHWDQVAKNPQALHKPILSLDFFTEKYLDLLTKMMREGLKPVLLSLPPLDHKAFFDFLSQHFNGPAILSYLGESKNIYLWQQDYDKKVREISQKLSLPLVDLRKIILEEENYQDYICPDGMHITPQGQNLFSQKLLQPIKEILK